MTQLMWLEPLAALLAVLMVVCNIARFKTGKIYWGWPLAILSSGLYLWVFGVNKLYGDAALQVLFIVLAFDGWLRWNNEKSWTPQALSASQALWGAALWLVLWLAITFVLSRMTDSDVPWLDGFVTAGSITATLYLARKYTLNWSMWLVVNMVSVWLFSVKSLWLTAALYVLLAVMSVVGWLQWRKLESPQA